MRGTAKVGVAWPLAIALALAIAALGALTPIYTDEIGWRLHERFGIDGIDRALSVTCGPMTSVVPPWFMIPVRQWSAFAIHLWSDPAAIRLAGVACALVWLAMLARVATDCAHKGEAAWLALFGIAMAATGILPFHLTVSRPEQPLLLCATLSVLMAFWAQRSQSRFALALAAQLVIATIACSYHPKAVGLSLLFASAIALSSRDRATWLPRVLAIAALAALAVVSARYWTRRFACPLDPELAEIVGQQSIGALAGNDLGTILSTLAHTASPHEYVIHMLPGAKHMSNWLPPAMVAPHSLWTVATFVLWISAMVFAAFLILHGWVTALRHRRAEAPLVLASAIGAFLVAWTVMQLHKNSYEAAIYFPLTIVVLLLLMPGFVAPPTLRRLAIAAAALAVANLAGLAISYGPTLWKTAARPGYIATQPNSLSPFGFGRIEPLVVRAAGRCGLTPANEGILVDDLSYHAFAASRRPYYTPGILGMWRGRIVDPAAALRDLGSDGLVLRCSALPDYMAAHAIETGGLCCMNAAMLASAAGTGKIGAKGN